MAASPPSSPWADAAAAALAAAATLLVAACGGSAARAELPDEPRRPDGVAVDPVMIPPAARGEALSSSGIVTLRSPLGTDRAMATVEELFRRIVAEDTDALPHLFMRDAVAHVPGGGGPGPTSNAIAWWEMRFKRLDYTKLAGEPIFRPADADVARGEASLEAVAVAAMRSESIGDDDVVIRAGILTTHAGADRLFGDEMIFWLRRDGEHYKIYRILEDFQLN